MYIYNYCLDLVKGLVIDEHFATITDFFELLEYGGNKKISLLATHPYIMEFVVRAYYSQNESISEDITQGTRMQIQESFSFYFNNIDFSKFKEDVDPAYVYRMLVWMTDGYLHELQSGHQAINVDEIMIEFYKWKEMFKKMVYKEEYQ